MDAKIKIKVPEKFFVFEQLERHLEPSIVEWLIENRIDAEIVGQEVAVAFSNLNHALLFKLRMGAWEDSIPVIPKYDPVILGLIRRTMPTLIAQDIIGVQPMTGPVGLIHALRARYANPSEAEEELNDETT